MKMKSRIISLILVVFVLVSIALVSASADTVLNLNGYVLSYHKDNTQFKIVGYDGDKTELSTPQIYNNKYITKIESYAFVNNKTIKSIKVNKHISYIGDYAFSTNVSLVTVELDSTVSTIGERAFSQCPKLSKITISNKDASIGADAFEFSSNVVIYCYKGSTAETYAKANKISYALLDDPQPTTEPTTGPTTEPTTEPVTETVAPTEPVKTTYIVGDGNDNGHIDISDATVVQLLMAKLIDDDGRLSQRIDINGACDITNATLLQMYLAKLSTIYDDAIGTTREYTK